MKTIKQLSPTFWTTVLLAGSLVTGSAQAQNEPATSSHAADARAKQSGSTRVDEDDLREEGQEAQQQVTFATKVISRMKTDPELMPLLQKARGVFIVPRFGKGAALVGARAGEGVLLLRNEGEWTGPAFYDFGGISVGAQAGGKAGAVAMLLLSERAVERFKSNEDSFSLNAAADLVIADYETGARASLTKSDVVVWADTRGLFAGVSLGVTGIRRDDEDNHAYYLQRATPSEIFAGSVENPHAEELRKELPNQTASR
jgi:SH3 domain-containing YSC84-like protein 1